VAAIPDTFLLRGIRFPVLPQLELESVATIPDTLFVQWIRLPKPSRSRSWNLWPPHPTPIICKGFVSKIPSAIGVGICGRHTRHFFVHWIRLPEPSLNRSRNLWSPYPTPVV
jgi:hypothetical protein